MQEIIPSYALGHNTPEGNPHSGPEFEKMARDFRIFCLMDKLCEITPDSITRLLDIGAEHLDSDEEQNASASLESVYQLIIKALKKTNPKGAPTTPHEGAIFYLGLLGRGATSYDELMDILTFMPLDGFGGGNIDRVIGETLLHTIAKYHHYSILQIIVEKLQDLNPSLQRNEILQFLLSVKNFEGRSVFSLINFEHLSSLPKYKDFLRELMLSSQHLLALTVFVERANDKQETASCKFYKNHKAASFGVYYSALHLVAMNQDVSRLALFLREGMNPNVSTRTGYKMEQYLPWPHNQPQKAEAGVIYVLANTQSYCVRDREGKVQEGNLPDIDLSNLRQKLDDPEFKKEILAITSSNDHTPREDNATNIWENRDTPLNLWVSAGHFKPNELVLSILLQFGANIEAKGLGNLTALELAIDICGASSQNYVPLLLKYGAHIGIEYLPRLLDLERRTHLQILLPLKQLDLKENPHFLPPLGVYQNHVKDIMRQRMEPGYEDTLINLADVILDHKLFGQPGPADELDVLPSPFPGVSHTIMPPQETPKPLSLAEEEEQPKNSDDESGVFSNLFPADTQTNTPPQETIKPLSPEEEEERARNLDGVLDDALGVSEQLGETAKQLASTMILAEGILQNLLSEMPGHNDELNLLPSSSPGVVIPDTQPLETPKPASPIKEKEEDSQEKTPVADSASRSPALFAPAPTSTTVLPKTPASPREEVRVRNLERERSRSIAEQVESGNSAMRTNIDKLLEPRTAGSRKVVELMRAPQFTVSEETTQKAIGYCQALLDSIYKGIQAQKQAVRDLTSSGLCSLMQQKCTTLVVVTLADLYQHDHFDEDLFTQLLQAFDLEDLFLEDSPKSKTQPTFFSRVFGTKPQPSYTRRYAIDFLRQRTNNADAKDSGTEYKGP